MLGGVRLFCRLPVPLLLGMARLASWPLAALARGRRRVVLANLQLCMPELSPTQRAKLASRNLRSTAVSLMENLLGWFAPNLESRLQLEGAEYLQQALRGGRGAIVLTPHFTMLELVPRALQLAARDDPSCRWQPTEVVRRHNWALLESIIDVGRQRWSPTIDKKDVRGMLRTLKQNRPLLTAPDQNFSYGSVFAPFFGIAAATTTGNLRLAAAAGCPTLLCLIRRLPGNQGWLVRIEPPLQNFPSADPLADATRTNALVEAAIRQVPEQYLWAHRRFRCRPPGEQSLYAGKLLKQHHRGR